MPIEVTASDSPITVSASGTKIDAAVSGGQGPAGPAATITVGTVTTGAPGSSASVVNAGTTSAAVLNFTIPAGATGATGPAGPQGPAGAAGASSWNDITGKPSTFTPSTHTHVIADVTGLQTALDGKQASGSYAAASHTHATSDITGLDDALSDIDSALSGKALAADFDQGVKTTDSPEFASVEFNAYAVDWTVAPRASFGAAFDFKATVGGVTTTAFAINNDGSVTFGDGTTQSTAAVPYSLPTASASVKGGVTIGSGIDITLGQISVSTTSIGAASLSHAHSAADITSGTLSASLLPTSGVAAGTYTSVTVDTYGRVTAGSSPSIAYSSLTGLPTLGSAAAASTSDFAAASHNHAASDIASGVIATARLASSGTASATTFLRGDQTWATAGSSSASDLTSGTLAYARMADPTVTSPSQITASQNDYASFARGINRFTTNAARDLTGMVAGSDGEVRVLCNVGTTAANTLVIKDQSSSSTAANRFAVPWAGDCVIPNGASVVCYYDGTTSRWRVIA